MEDARGAIRRPPEIGQQPRIAIGSYTSVRRDKNSRRRIKDAGKLIEGYVTGPVVCAVSSRLREQAVSRSSNWNLARSLVADVAVYVCIDHVLRWPPKSGEVCAKLLPVPRRVNFQKGNFQ